MQQWVMAHPWMTFFIVISLIWAIEYLIKCIAVSVISKNRPEEIEKLADGDSD